MVISCRNRPARATLSLDRHPALSTNKSAFAAAATADKMAGQDGATSPVPFRPSDVNNRAIYRKVAVSNQGPLTAGGFGGIIPL